MSFSVVISPWNRWYSYFFRSENWVSEDRLHVKDGTETHSLSTIPYLVNENTQKQKINSMLGVLLIWG